MLQMLMEAEGGLIGAGRHERSGEWLNHRNGFRDRTLSGEWPYLRPDAPHLRQREGGRTVSVAALIAVACDAEGRREIVGLRTCPSEAKTF
jgi:transposase-like protein